ncbi:MAG: outer membrane beta-barrel protein [Mariprofundales bacterium]
MLRFLFGFWVVVASVLPAYALEIPPLTIGGGVGVATVYLNPSQKQTNLPLYQLQAEGDYQYLSVLARAGASGNGDRQFATGLLTTQADYFYSLMIKPRIALFDTDNSAYLLGGWSKFRMRSTLGTTTTLSNRASFGYGIGLQRNLGKPFSIGVEYMRYTTDIRAATLNFSYTLP